MSMHGARRELRRLREKLRAEDRDFRAAAPPVDEDGLPCWGGKPGLSVAAYTRLLDQDIPAEDLTDEERTVRARLSPYRALFERLGREEAEKEGAAVR